MDDHIIHENYYLSFSNHPRERFVHITLECGRRVSLSKEHDEGFKNSSWHYKHRFPLISSLYTDIGESPAHIELGKVRRRREIVQ